LVFWLLWFVATLMGLFLEFIPIGLIVLPMGLVLGLDRLDDPARLSEFLPAWTLVLAAVLCGAGVGAVTGLAQWLVLRRELRHTGGWVAATAAGYASIGVLPLLANALQPGWSDWAFTLIVTGKMHWLARVQPDWPAAASWLAGGITLILFAAALGIMQWLVLRRRVAHAGWWVLVSTAAWALTVALTPMLSWADFVTASWALPAAATGAAMVWLLRRPAHAISTAG
jgi:hypothetical protein